MRLCARQQDRFGVGEIRSYETTGMVLYHILPRAAPFSAAYYRSVKKSKTLSIFRFLSLASSSVTTILSKPPASRKSRTKMMFKTLLASLALTAVTVDAAGQWSRRIYYDNLPCNPNHYAHLLSVYIPNAPCAGKTTAEESLLAVCIPKSDDPLAPSSEGSGCDTVTSDLPSDAEWIPRDGQGSKRPNTPYLVVNTYGNVQGCAVTSTTNSISQTVYAADGKCYAYEPGVFFKAACNSAQGIVTWCKDSACTRCGEMGTLSEGIAGTWTLNADCTGSAMGSPSRSICSGGGNSPLPNWTVSNGTATTTTATRTSTTASSGQGTASVSSIPTAAATQGSGVGKVEVGVGAVVAAVVGALAL
ncbi:hypothetical protein HK097_008839 [Rhizophlyctis rosea]|uniref:Uncharacterized protein n=1 Tax=Rhizophlyctis rosea TaxID=64517 RepID=A0AAD5X0U9_9FUNG|nr:hypothetical protein HK097_008839 [Rhizophlyctis rosea]